MPTALELTREEWQPYIEAARRRPTLHDFSPVEHHEREQLLSRIHEAAAILKSRFGARRVILFGSLADAEWFTPDSDVDLAVEGLAADAYWQAWRLTEEIIGDRTVDLVDIETAKESLLRAIRRYGVEL
jgi:predicted nucleotidyltransferase